MISSMTGYACEQSDTRFGRLTWELRSVNHRYLETSFRLPECFRHIEITWRQWVAQHVARGKLDFTLKFQPAEEMVNVSFNQPLLLQLSDYAQQVAALFPHPHTQVEAILNWPGMLKTEELDIGGMDAAATELLKTALKKLSDVRLREGEGLKEFFETHLQQLQAYVMQITTRMPQVMQGVNQRIVERFHELKLELDPNRFEQELTWLAQKVDVTEELKRLSLHIDEFKHTVLRGGVVGRRLDFLTQELNREANTLASKSIDASVTHLAVELKVLIEQIREQVQNIE